MRSWSGRTRGIAVLVPALALLAGCAAGVGRVPSAEGPAPTVVPAAWPARDTDYPPPAADSSCDPRESLTPMAQLPAPGRMPAGSTMAAIVERRKLVVGVDQNTTYFASLQRHSQKLAGFDIEMAEAVGLALFGEPGHVSYQVITQAQRIPFLEAGTVDLVVNTMTITCDRKERVAFSGNYYDDGQKVLVPFDSTAADIADLAGKRVCTARMTTSIRTLRDRGVQPYAVDNWTDCLVALQRGEVDAVSTTGALLAGLAAQDQDVRITGPRFTDEPHGMAVRKDRGDFVRFLNALLVRMLQDGTWQKLYDQWLAQPFAEDRKQGLGKPPESHYRG
ncbi:glutamate ABC transporter substrate-binding protein [Yinghuangia soli]|uniref:Glutamate ABC transporter substrate-binding protein n=1 Tax=Yinghuangia soli TaxID=2908204 RepID=A0AA41U3M6_9ACTN|nr:glutamate ABC transporter substrate-binding protein [Yinghuangia soli]MCF2531976.1 glutamate ABC transporter substrate-binding protein [Yinghuangia soli]